MSNSLRVLPFAALVLLFLVAPGRAHADARADLMSGWQKMLDGRLSTETVSNANGKQSTVRTRLDTIQRVHMKTDGMEIILLPEGTWMKMNGAWSKPPFDVGGMVKKMLPMTLEQAQAGVTNIRDEGATRIDGQALRAIGFDQNTTLMGINVRSHNTVFLDPSGRIVRSEGSSEARGDKSTHVQTMHYDDSIRVTAPN